MLNLKVRVLEEIQHFKFIFVMLSRVLCHVQKTVNIFTSVLRDKKLGQIHEVFHKRLWVETSEEKKYFESL